MKTYKLRTVAAAIVVAFVAGIFAMQASTIIIGTLATWTTGTNYSSAANIGTTPIPGKTITIQHGGLAATNNLPVYAQLSLDGTNYLTIAGPWYPSATNAGSYTWQVPSTNMTVYERIYSVQTNTVTIGASIQ